MFYPQDFKNRVKRAYPELELLHQRLDEGDDFAYRYLQSIKCLPCVLYLHPGALSVDTVLEGTSLEELKKRSIDEKTAIEKLQIPISTNIDIEFERRYEALKSFYPDKKAAKSLFMSSAAFSADYILHSKSFIVLHEEAVLRKTREDLFTECMELYSSQNS